MFVPPRRSRLQASAGCVRVFALDSALDSALDFALDFVGTLFRARASRGGNMHCRWCDFSSARRRENSLVVEIYRSSPICCIEKNRPLEIVFSQLTPPTERAKVSSTCAAAPFGEVRGSSRIPTCRSIWAGIGVAQSGHTSQPLAMLCATRSDLREARGPLQPIGCELPIRWGQQPAVHRQPHRMQRTARRLSWTQSWFGLVYLVAVGNRQSFCQSAQPMRFGRPRTGSGWTGEREHARSGTC